MVAVYILQDGQVGTSIARFSYLDISTEWVLWEQWTVDYHREPPISIQEFHTVPEEYRMPYLYFPCTMFSTRRTASGVLALNVKFVTPWAGAYSQHVAQVIAPNGPFTSFDAAQCTLKRLEKAISQSDSGVSSTHIERLHHLNDRILHVESLWLKQGLEEYIFQSTRPLLLALRYVVAFRRRTRTTPRADARPIIS